MIHAPPAPTGKPLNVFLVVGEQSGDQLGGRLIRALRAATQGRVCFQGVAGEAMQAEGMSSLFPLSDIAVMGFLPVIKRLPRLIRRVYAAVDAIAAADPDVLVIIDSPDFTHATAKRVRQRLPSLPIIDYVSPSVWAWRPGRAKTMRGYIDHVLALLPFEPTAHERLGGPACVYVGHPLIERLDDLRPDRREREARDAVPATVVVLPGSRRSEIERLMPDFGAAIAEVASAGATDIVLPAVAHHSELVKRLAATWSVKPRIVTGEAAKLAAFRCARVALAASGTVTLELALAGVPMVVAYKVSPIEAAIARRLIQVPTIVLPNLILGEHAIPQLVQSECEPARLAAALIPLLRGGAEREAQCAALARLDTLMCLPDGDSPSARAARIVLDIAGRKRAGSG